MSNFINWICFFSVSLLVLDIMIFLNKDIKNVYYKSIENTKTKVTYQTQKTYKKNIAK